jgi:hypothetical protein
MDVLEQILAIGVVPAEAAAIGAKASDPNAPDTAMNDDNADNLNKPSISSENPSVADVASGNDGNTNDKASDSNENGGFRDPGLPAQSLLPETNYVPDRSEIASCDGRTLTLNATVLPDGTVSYSMTVRCSYSSSISLLCTLSGVMIR